MPTIGVHSDIGQVNSFTFFSKPKLNQHLSSTEFEVRLHCHMYIHHPYAWYGSAPTPAPASGASLGGELLLGTAVLLDWGPVPIVLV